MRFKTLLLLSALFLSALQTKAQSVAINTDGSTANASALLDVKSNTKGILIPRMSRAERDAIASPATGLLIFQTSPDSVGYHYYDGSNWTWMFGNSNADSLAWKAKGNTGTNPANHFLGTTDNVPLVIKTNNTEQMRIQPNGFTGIGTNNPFSLLANTSSNTGASDGFGVNSPSFSWAMNIGGYVGAFYNANPNPSRGLMVKIAGTLPASRILDLSTGSSQTVAGTPVMVVNGDGKVGIGLTNPSTQFANNSGNTVGNDGVGLNAQSLNWSMNNGGYTAGIYNQGTGSNNNGLAVKVASSVSGTRILDLSAGAAQNTAGTSVLVAKADGKVGIGIPNPDASALLDVASTTRGMLIPRMSKTEKNAIASPATGLLIFQNAPDSIGFYYYNGSNWTWMFSNSNADSLAWRTGGNTGTTTNNFLGTRTNNPLIIKTNDAEVARFTGNKELGIGTTTPNSTYGFAKVEIASEGYGSPTDLLIRNAVNDGGYAPGLVFQHARGTLATPTAVNNGDYLSAIGTMNYDGSNYVLSAGLDIYADGTISTGIVPTRLMFNTMNTAGSYATRLTIKNDGKVGIGITAPLSRTHIHNGNFLVTGDGTSAAIEPTGAGTRLFFYPLKYAFRAGYVNSTQWDDANIGQGSIGLGFNALASNLNAIAMGENSQAKSANSVSIGSGNITETEQFAVAIGRNNHSTGYASVAMGHFSEATGHYSVSFGLRDTVSGFGAAAIGSNNKVFADAAFAGGNANTVTANYSFAGGHANAVSGGNSFAGGLSNTVSGSEAFAGGNNNTVSGNSGVALGRFNFSPSFGEATVGLFATQYSPASATAFNANDRVFTIGNGTGTGSRSDAMVVLKNGKTGIGSAAPSAKLHVGGGTRFTVLDTGAIFLQSGNTIGSARDWKIAVTLPNGYLSFRDMGFDNSGTGAMAADAMVIAWGTGNVGIATPAPNSTLHVDGTVAIGTSLNIAGGPSGTPISLLNQKSYVGVLPANGTNNYYQLPDPTLYPGRTYIIRNNSSVFQANIATAAGLLFPGNSDVGGATYTLNPTSSPKTVMAISDGANWTIMVQN